ncbi:hypothetical protein [Embleya sp. AB8]|uniref:hypothetical protein n=1 Tax=Embleya sp. AB8 TaxID=3156304 RepID=UPI003C756689
MSRAWWLLVLAALVAPYWLLSRSRGRRPVGRQRGDVVRALLTTSGDAVRLWSVDHPGPSLDWQRTVAVGYGFRPAPTLATLFERSGPGWAEGLGRYAGGPAYGVLRTHPAAVAAAAEVAGRGGFDVLDPVAVGRLRAEADRIARGIGRWTVPLALCVAGPVAFGLPGAVAGAVGGRPEVARIALVALTIGVGGAGLCGYGRHRARTAFEHAVGDGVAAYREVVAAMAEAEAARLGATEEGSR